VRRRASLTTMVRLVCTHARQDSVVTMLPRLRISCLGAQGHATKDRPQERWCLSRFALSRLRQSSGQWIAVSDGTFPTSSAMTSWGLL
jgi:hypothetical protein